MSKEKHLFLIDGSGYIFRAYYALPPLTRKSDGLPVGAVSGFCNMLYSLSIICVFVVERLALYLQTCVINWNFQ